MTNNVVTFVMAGGKGERLYPLTKDRTKPAVPFGGIYRIIDFSLSNCINSGFRKIHVLTQFKSISLARHLRMGWDIFEAELGEYIDLIPAQKRVGEDWYKGTADSIYQNIYTIEMERPSYLLLLAGDHIYKMDYRNILNFHIENKAVLTVAGIEMDISKAREFGVIEVDSSMSITGFQEKPISPKAIPGRVGKAFVSMGIYLFNKEIAEEELTRDAEDENSSHDFGRDIIPNMVSRNKKVLVYDFRDKQTGLPMYWRDIGTIDAYYEANMDLVSNSPIFNLYDRNWPIRTYQEQFPPAKTVFPIAEENIECKGQAINSLISNGCIISGGTIEHSVLSPNVRVNSFSYVLDSILMEGVEIGRNVKIKKAIIDKDVYVPEGVQIGYNIEEDKRRFFVTVSGIVVVAKGVKL